MCSHVHCISREQSFVSPENPQLKPFVPSESYLKYSGKLQKKFDDSGSQT